MGGKPTNKEVLIVSKKSPIWLWLIGSHVFVLALGFGSHWIMGRGVEADLNHRLADIASEYNQSQSRLADSQRQLASSQADLARLTGILGNGSNLSSRASGEVGEGISGLESGSRKLDGIEQVLLRVQASSPIQDPIPGK